jgi:hypothetical protein
MKERAALCPILASQPPFLRIFWCIVRYVSYPSLFVIRFVPFIHSFLLCHAMTLDFVEFLALKNQANNLYTNMAEEKTPATSAKDAAAPAPTAAPAAAPAAPPATTTTASATTPTTETAAKAAAATTTAATTTTDTVAAAVAAATAATTTTDPAVTTTPIKVIPAVPLPEPERDPNIPSDRDAIVDDDRHRGTMLLADLVRLHYFLWKKQQYPPKPTEEMKKEEDKPTHSASTETKTDPPKEDAAAAATDAAAKPKEEEKSKEEEKATEEKKPEETKPTTPTTTTTTTPTKVEPPTEANDVKALATRLIELFKDGRRYELSGLKDVPTPFFKGEGRFFEKTPSSDSETDEKKKWKRLDDAGTKTYVSNLILKSFKELSESDNKEAEKPPVASDDDEETEAAEINKSVDILFENLKDLKTGEEARSDPRPYDVLFLPVESPWEESMNYEHQSGNKNLLYLASQHVSVDTKESISRVKAAFALVTAKVQVSSGTELVTQNQRFVIQRTAEDNTAGQKLWKNMERDDLAEFASIFVFEVYLEKRIYEETMIGNNIVDSVGTPVTPGSTQAAMKDLLSPSDANKPSDVPIPNPTTHDVLFGRGYVI